MPNRNNDMVATVPVGPRVQGMSGVVLGSLVLAAHNFSLDLTVAAPNSLITGTVLVITGLLQFSAGVRLLRGRCHTLTTLYLSLSVLWGSLGSAKILEVLGILSLDNRRDGLLPGYGVFLFLTLFLGIAATKESSIVSWICFLLSFSMVMEIVALFYPAGRWGAACYQALPVLLGLYYVVGLTVSYCTGNAVCLPGMRRERQETDEEDDQIVKNDVLSFAYAMNMIPTCVLALFFVGATHSVNQAAPWMALAGLAQLLVSVVSFRREDVFHGAVLSLSSTFWLGITYGFLSTLWGKAELAPPFLASSILVLIFLIFFLLSFTQTISDVVYNLCFAILVLSLPTTGLSSTYLGISSILLLLISLYCTFALALNSAFRRTLVPVGRSLLPQESLRELFSRCRCARQGYESLPSSSTTDNVSTSTEILGYSTYASADTLGFLSNAVTALAVALLSTGDRSLVLPWVIVPGGVIQFVAGTISFSRGKTFESTAFMVYSMMWLLWGSVRYSGVYRGSEGLSVAAGAASFLLFNLFVIFLSVVINKAWLVLSVVFEVVCVLFLLDALGVQTSQYFELAVMCVFGAVCVYCFCVHLLNGMCGEEVMSLGSPLLTLRSDRGGEQVCVMADARKANGVKQIAELMKDGGICGMPTDTVYVLVAACNRPAAVERAYRTKKQAEERPMSIWISQLSQLEPAREEFGPLLWDFMKEVWPSSISLVIKRGPWLDRFGLGDSARYIGTPESIAIRIPDCTVATHLIDLVGPIAVTSANPSGEADTTHHSQVRAKLGDNVDGVLCDGPSPENVASTVVNCAKIDEGELGFFRVGIVPRAQVIGIFDSVRRRHGRSGSAGRRNNSSPRRHYGSTNAARTRVDVVRDVASGLAGVVAHAQDDDSDIGASPQVAVVGGTDDTANSLAFSTTNLLNFQS
ncbi:YRDC [Branchiostoma lanceolatum]|uniref:Threonylcarbamoyl-AMP synthase n=1 Tax=Branchiostoma lanceolatum TaxID=7740 RepID=A0A8K0ETB2_BRALA|nr:YRDC [Branchiostoma lanceolatum]